jgi:hypothetical protein
MKLLWVGDSLSLSLFLQQRSTSIISNVARTNLKKAMLVIQDSWTRFLKKCDNPKKIRKKWILKKLAQHIMTTPIKGRKSDEILEHWLQHWGWPIVVHDCCSFFRYTNMSCFYSKFESEARSPPCVQKGQNNIPSF